MRIKKIVLCGILAIAVALVGSPAWLGAQDTFPKGPITIIVPFPPGFVDMGARTISESLSKELGVPVIIENKTGGGGLIGATAFINSRPDGHTLLASTASAVISSVLLSKTPPFDPRKDLVPVAYLGDTPAVMAIGTKSLPQINTFDEFLKYAKANPGKLRGAVSGIGGEIHIMYETLVRDASINSKFVPYPGIANLITGILGGHLDWWCGTLPGVLQYQKSGDMKILLATRKDSDLPNVPSGADVGLPRISGNSWTSLFAHPKAPKEATDRLIAAVAKVIQTPEVAQKYAGTGFHPAYRPPAELAKLVSDSWDFYSQMIKEANIQIQ